MKSSVITRQLEIEGVVQGVGFRPFLFMLAQTHHLYGEVSNTADGVKIVVEGTSENIKQFSDDIRLKLPRLASIKNIRSADGPCKHFSEFKILKSQPAGHRNTLISPDVATCSDCLEEMQDKDNRRYEYPFINCTNCGPRFTIIEDIPYDRPKTSMKAFGMCESCQKEYDDPANRRFHAQPNACPDCGPHIFLTDSTGKKITTGSQHTLSFAANSLSQGRILAVKGLGGFHLACDAASADAVQRLREKKIRQHKPFALMAGSIQTIRRYVHVNEMEKQLLESYHRPIVLLRKKQTDETPCPGGPVNAVAPFNPCLGVMLPYTPLHSLLLAKGPDILVMTSGNRSKDPLSIDNQDALDAFGHIADYFLLHNRDIYFRADDSIMRVQAGQPRFIRRSRGYAPLPVHMDKKMAVSILGCGAELKNTVCVTRNSDVFLSQHIGDLGNLKSQAYFKTSIAHLKQIFDVQPQIIAHDLHPGYMSTRYAITQSGIKKQAVQHHHAHAVSCMAENNVDEPVLAITLDGTGYGTDGHIWGGEILLCTRKEFKRKAHLCHIPMPGADKATLEPWRMAASFLYAAFGKDFLNLDIEYIQQIEKQKLEFVCQMIRKKLNSPLTSSTGRLFDAVASLLCLCHEISHESQAAMALEAIAQSCQDDSANAYAFNITAVQNHNKDTVFEMDMLPCIRQIITDLRKKQPENRISLKFHQTLVDLFSKTAVQICQETGIHKVVLSGGVFNNDIILQNMIHKLTALEFEVFTHTQVPTGDGGICLGQVMVAAALEENGS
ncbi:MAG: carbamoyltransferase HypF [Proteobacteria bacterium]|nr:carbamoyltransferase HypF [Pseudomonadota bacterium]MBU1386500.1 carbamoyltransferase HypF [Pseudomonadota bacterium]MBU1544611.1 carbamoyltransferase HypF [Pseudomonadota bacterium]MBU2430285.1 carbamoyltransferase HypF [Pseudomonadota bacterium]MBU2481410.1 carbamoyltransferase HypF [Pseudomonadota bacterium]